MELVRPSSTHSSGEIKSSETAILVILTGARAALRANPGLGNRGCKLLPKSPRPSAACGAKAGIFERSYVLNTPRPANPYSPLTVTAHRI